MSTLTQPPVAQMAKALLVVCSPGVQLSASQSVQLTGVLLPRTSPQRAAETVAGIRDHLQRAALYEHATAQQAAEWFADVHPTEASSACMASTLRERAPVWRGEAETLALTAVLNDRNATPQPSWKEPAA